MEYVMAIPEACWAITFGWSELLWDFFNSKPGLSIASTLIWLFFGRGLFGKSLAIVIAFCLMLVAFAHVSERRSELMEQVYRCLEILAPQIGVPMGQYCHEHEFGACKTNEPSAITWHAREGTTQSLVA
jgi:hypothetical protein